MGDRGIREEHLHVGDAFERNRRVLLVRPRSICHDRRVNFSIGDLDVKRFVKEQRAERFERVVPESAIEHDDPCTVGHVVDRRGLAGRNAFPAVNHDAEKDRTHRRVKKEEVDRGFADRARQRRQSGPQGRIRDFLLCKWIVEDLEPVEHPPRFAWEAQFQERT